MHNTHPDKWLSCFHMLAIERGHDVQYDFKYIDKRIKNEDGTTKTIKIKKPQSKINKASIKQNVILAENVKNIIEPKTYKDQLANDKFRIIQKLGMLHASDKMKEKICGIYS